MQDTKLFETILGIPTPASSPHPVTAIKSFDPRYSGTFRNN